MDELAKAITAGIDNPDDIPGFPGDSAPLQLAAEAWAQHALRNYRGRTMEKALAISASVSEFVAYLLHGEGGADDHAR